MTYDILWYQLVVVNEATLWRCSFGGDNILTLVLNLVVVKDYFVLPINNGNHAILSNILGMVNDLILRQYLMVVDYYAFFW